MKELLLEIGAEEVPARFLPATAESLKVLASAHLAEQNISFGSINAFVTPRRLALIVEGLPDTQPDVVKEVFGPPRKMAFDSAGAPSKAALGFAKSVGVPPEKLMVREKSSGEYVVALVEEKGRPVREVLPEILKKVILSLNFPKSMRWGDGSLRFVRPIRWVLALLDFEVLVFNVDGISSSSVTRGHRFLSPGSFQIREAHTYRKLLETNFVIVDQDKRRSVILGELEKLSSSVEGVFVQDEALLDEVVNLVEYPVGVLCEFSKEYLDLPEELLITVMKGHQKYFAVRDKRDRIINYFIVISNSLRENSLVIRAGAERVIRARFEDARFYYREDLKKTLASRVDELKKVVYIEGLGTLFDKSERLRKMASHMAGVVCPDLAKEAEKAALLAKADLISGVVREFTELQGVMGRYFAAYDGEPPEVADVIFEHYLPRHMGDALPSTKLGAVLAVSDRVDNIASFFSLGLVPSGSEDPFALRRQAIAVASILTDGEYDLTIGGLVDKALEGLGKDDDQDLRAGIIRFFESRFPQILEARGYEPDAVDSVLPLSTQIPLKYLFERLEAVKGFRKSDAYGTFLLAIKRVRNIIPPRKLPPLDAALFSEDKEKALHESLLQVSETVNSHLAGHRYDEAIGALTGLAAPINAFFDSVLVMDKDERIRDNRLSLLSEIWSLALGICDFSKLAEV
jgi:glycyl-tRNA synthetase beta chain